MILLYLVNAYMLILSKTPLMMSFTVLMQAILVSFSIYAQFNTPWFSFIMVLIFISAMMVIYVYVSSIAYNHYLYLKDSPILPLMLLMTFILMLTISAATYTISPSSFLLSHDLNLSTGVPYKIYSPFILPTCTFLILYLLIALLVVAKIVSNHVGPLQASST